MAEYKKSQARVRDLVEKRRLLERRLVSRTFGVQGGAITNNRLEPGRGGYRPKGGSLPRQHAKREHHHGLRQLHEGYKWRGGAATENRTHGAESGVLAIVNVVSTEQWGRYSVTGEATGRILIILTEQDGLTPGSTPGSHVPTPISGTYRDSGSNQPTPTSATTGKNKSKKKETEESENDTQAGKKRTNFGAQRK